MSYYPQHGRVWYVDENAEVERLRTELKRREEVLLSARQQNTKLILENERLRDKLLDPAHPVIQAAQAELTELLEENGRLRDLLGHILDLRFAGSCLVKDDRCFDRLVCDVVGRHQHLDLTEQGKDPDSLREKFRALESERDQLRARVEKLEGALRGILLECETGFVECGRCSHEETMSDLDIVLDIKTALASAEGVEK